MEEGKGENKPIFRELAADDPDPEAMKIESLCVNCGKDGETRLLLTKIPFYKEVVLSSFQCEHCGFTNNDIQPGGQIQDKGIRITVEITAADDLNRQVVKSDNASIKIKELDFEIPAQSQKGEITTVEGIIQRSIAGLEQEQPLRKIDNPDSAEEIEKFLDKMKELLTGKPFTLVLEDISGNSFIENPNAPAKDPAMKINHFKRTKEQDHILGIFEKKELEASEEDDGILKEAEAFTYEDLLGEVLQFRTNCPNCSSPCSTNMKMTSIL
ncbi:hypothetical protein J437_LFUL015074 [Ladona fulva]|uniref:Zinc finger ZPR1-type domain-containing protein n=1 Tax=Ladona fulva TaxID=123851 RepID=A0A8K0P7K8_LADFU|nr:hypothetical protein J437_LFUL015074 [Ladona fulva]